MNPTTGWQILTHTDRDEGTFTTVITVRIPNQDHHFEYFLPFKFSRRMGVRAYEAKCQHLLGLLEALNKRVAAGPWAPRPKYWTRVDHAPAALDEDQLYYENLRDPDLEP